MLGHALIFDGLSALADIERLEYRAFDNAFDEAGLDWLWDAEELGHLRTIEDGAERIRLYAAEVGASLTLMEIDQIHKAACRHFTHRASRFGVPLRPRAAKAIAQARKEGLKVGLASRHALAPVVRLYSGAGLKLDALAPDVAGVMGILGTAEMKVLSYREPQRLLEAA